MQSENRLSSAIFPSRDVAERAASELRRIGLANIRLSEARPSDAAPTFAAFVREAWARFGPKRSEPTLVDGVAPLGSFAANLARLGIPPGTVTTVRQQLRAGATLLTVRSGDQTERAMAIMRSFYAPATAEPAIVEPAIVEPATPPVPVAAPAPEPAPNVAPEPPPIEPSAARSADAPDGRSRPLSPAETVELANAADPATLARLQAMGGLTVRKVTVVEHRRLDVELRREELIIARDGPDDGDASPSEIRIPLSHEEATVEKRVVLAQWQRLDLGALDRSPEV